jgi:hypothetical protein
MWIIAVCMLLICLPRGAVSADGSGESLLTEIPSDFQGRWLSSKDQCAFGHEGWLYVSKIKLEEANGTGYVVSVRRVTAVEIEVDMTWRPSTKNSDDWRKVARLVITQNGRSLIETQAGKSVTRVRCDQQ